MPILSALGLLVALPVSERPSASPPPSAIVDALEWRNIGPSAAAAWWRWPASRASPSSTTSAAPAAASGRPRTPASAGSRSPTASSAPARWARSRSRDSDPNVVYVGHGRGLHPRQRLARRRRLQVDGRGQDLDARRPARHAADRPRCACIRSDPDLVYVAALGHAFGPNKERGVFRSQGRRARPGRRCSSSTTRRARSTWRWTRPTRACSTPGFWQVRAHAVGLRQRRARAARSTSRTDGGDTWKKLTGEGLPEGRRGAASASRSRPRNPDRVWAIDRGRGRRRLPLRRRGPHLAAHQRGPRACASAPGTTRTSTPTRRTRTRSTC